MSDAAENKCDISSSSSNFSPTQQSMVIHEISMLTEVTQHTHSHRSLLFNTLCSFKGNLLQSPMSSEKTSSFEKRACRICHSESGVMVRPCGCTGTMGDIHEICLSKWVTQSNKQECEICNEIYARSGWRVKNPHKWSKPNFGMDDIVTIFLLSGLTYSIYYVISVLEERFFLERFSKLPCRSDDLGRLLILVVMVCTLIGTINGILRQIRLYLNRQREIRFINKC